MKIIRSKIFVQQEKDKYIYKCFNCEGIIDTKYLTSDQLIKIPVICPNCGNLLVHKKFLKDFKNGYV